MTGEPRLSSAQLEERLRQVGPLLASPDPVELSGAVTARLRAAEAAARTARPVRRMRLSLRGRPWTAVLPAARPVLHPAWQRAVAVLGAAVVVLSAVLIFSPGSRRAVAGWLGLRGVRIEVTPTLSPAPTRLGAALRLGQPLTLAQAQARVPFRIHAPGALGPPDEIYLSTRIPGGAVSLVYEAAPGLPPASTTGVGLLLTEFQGSVDVAIAKKIIGLGTTVEFVTVNGGQGFWISGKAHVVAQLDRNGSEIPDTVRLAGDVLVWEQGDLTLRIESALPEARVLQIAQSVR